MISLFRGVSNRGAAHWWQAGEIRVYLPSQGAEIPCAASWWVTLPLPGKSVVPHVVKKKNHRPSFQFKCFTTFDYAITFSLSLSMSPFPSHSISPPPNPPSICHSLLPLFHHPFLLLTSIRNVKKCQFFFLRLLTSGLVPGGLPQSWTMVMPKTGVKGILIGWFKMTCIVSASKTTLYTIIMYLWGKRTISTHQHTIKCDKLPIILPFF